MVTDETDPLFWYPANGRIPLQERNIVSIQRYHLLQGGIEIWA
jgi:hypothetical protein